MYPTTEIFCHPRSLMYSFILLLASQYTGLAVEISSFKFCVCDEFRRKLKFYNQMVVNRARKRSGKYRVDIDRHPAWTRLLQVIHSFVHLGDVRFSNEYSQDSCARPCHLAFM